jgi:hypothetical protein
MTESVVGMTDTMAESVVFLTDMTESVAESLISFMDTTESDADPVISAGQMTDSIADPLISIADMTDSTAQSLISLTETTGSTADSGHGMGDLLRLCAETALTVAHASPGRPAIPENMQKSSNRTESLVTWQASSKIARPFMAGNLANPFSKSR